MKQNDSPVEVIHTLRHWQSLNFFVLFPFKICPISADHTFLHQSILQKFANQSEI